jgi:uncharacterized membrane protein YcaP (DUF421 family)
MNHAIEIVLRSILAYSVMMIVARVLGKSTIAQLTYHDFVAAITLGALTANLAFNIQMPISQLGIALLTFSAVAFLLMILSLKSRKLRKWLSGQPTILIQGGKILDDNMRKLKISLDTMNQELREKNIFNIEEVQYAVLELNGKISVLRKPEFLPVTHKDLKLKLGQAQSFPIELIMDGQIIEDNLQMNNLKKDWLLSLLKTKGFSVENVFYAVKSANGHIFVDPYKDQISHTIDKE